MITQSKPETRTISTGDTMKAVLNRPTETKPQSGQSKFLDYTKSQWDELSQALPKELTYKKFVEIVSMAIYHNPKLREVTPASMIEACIQSVKLGLTPNTPLGEAYIIPYKDKATFQIGYQGLLAMCWRTGLYKTIVARPVHKDDQFDFEYGLEQSLTHKPATIPKGSPIYYYALLIRHDGGKDFIVMSHEYVEAYARQYSKSYDKPDGPWKKNFGGMALKTVLTRLLKHQPKSTNSDLNAGLIDVSDDDSSGASLITY
jgi:recombination protein RecT